MSGARKPGRAELEARIVSEIATQLALPADRVSTSARFSELGLDSVRATAVLARLGEWLQRPLAATLMWDHATASALAAHLATDAAPSGVRPAPPRPAPVPSAPDDEPIAIVGIGCRFPGGASSPAAYWDLLVRGVDAVTEVPACRWDADALFDADRSAPGKMGTRRGAFLDAIDGFDHGFFGISPREAAPMDPQQRLMLELAWEALEDAGIPPHALRGTRTGVWLGVIWNDYATLCHRLGLDAVVQHTATGSHASIVANRISFFLGAEGPSMTVDTACSSSLVAVHLACESLRRGEATLALAGGVNLVAAPDSTLAMSKFGAMAPDGRSKAFDARADGYCRGEGGGVVVLKPLSRALADGDPVYCVIVGSAVNNDGFSNGLTAPNPAAQEGVLRAAYERAGREPSSVQYVEAHGTGTILGDPIEVKSLGAVLGAGRVGAPLRIGSVKTNIGHLEAAAGIAGLVKVALAIRHRALPASLHFERPNPHIPFESLRVEVQSRLGPWPDEHAPLLAGVSGFGFGGTNCHVVLEAPARDDEVLVMPISASDAAALRSRVRELRDELEDLAPDALPGFVRAAAEASEPGAPHRLAVTGRSRKDLAAALRAAVKAGLRDATTRPAVVFVCAGQGGQWLGMGRDLLSSEPVFRASIEATDRLVREEAGWSILDELAAPAARSRLASVDVVQPTIFAVQVALAALWGSFGVRPDALVGHSMGEVAAAHLAGILRLEDAVRVVVRRSRLVQRAAGLGAMAVVGIPSGQAAWAIAHEADTVAVAAANGPSSTVLSGDPTALERVLRRLEAEGTYVGRINVDYASHSPHMDPLCAPLLEALQAIAPGRAHTRMISTVTLRPLSGTECGPGYWARNLREPVLFAQAVAGVLREGPACFVELSPHATLGRFVEDLVADAPHDGLVCASMRRGEPGRAVLSQALAAVWSAGVDVAWERVVGATPTEHEGPIVVPLSAATAPALRQRARDLVGTLLGDPAVRLADLGYTASVRRTHLDERAVVVAGARHELVDALAALSEGAAHPALAVDRVPVGSVPQVVFVFGGQGSQWWPMGRRLLGTEPVFRHTFLSVDRLFGAYSVANDGPYHLLLADDGRARLDDTAAAQVAIFALQVALVDLWRSWGVMPAAVVGHSVGEVAAAWASGSLTLEDAVAVVHHRSRLMQQAGPGKMLAAWLSPSEAEAYCSDRVSVAGFNGPASVVFSGDEDAVDAVAARLAASGVAHKPLAVRYAFHSARVAAFQEPLAASLAGLRPRPAVVPMVSSVSGRRLQGVEIDGHYWARNLREPVRFEPAVRRLVEDGHTTFLEVGPHPLSCGYVEEILADRGVAGVAIPSLVRHRDEAVTLRHAIARLHARGCAVRLDALHPRGGRPIPLPAYPWQRERHWLPDAAGWRRVDAPVATFERRGPHPDAWSGPVVGGVRLLAIGAVAALALRAYREATGHPGGVVVEDLVVERPAAWRPAADAAESVVLVPDGRDAMHVTLQTRLGSAWAPCARARLRPVPSPAPVADDALLEAALVGVREGLVRGVGALALLRSPTGPVRVVHGPAGDLEVLDTGDRVVATVHGLRVEPAETLSSVDPGLCHGLLHELAWVAAPTAPSAVDGERWVVVAEAPDLARGIVDRAARHGIPCALVGAGADALRPALAAALSGAAAHWQVVCVGTPPALVLAAAQALAASPPPVPVGFVVVTRGATALGRHDPAPDAAAALSWGIARGVAVEHPEFATRIVDLDGRRSVAACAFELVQELRRRDGEELVAIREGARHVARIGRLTASPTTRRAPVRADGTYLVTGGLGGLGLEVARWLAARGAGHLVLVGRSAPGPAAAAAVEVLRQTTRVTVATADVAVDDEVRALVAGLAGPPLRGVVHAAGSLAPAELRDQTPDHLARVLAPKVSGTMHLREATRGAALDFFVCFSSLAALLPFHGGVNYAAANAFLGAYARAARAEGCPMVAVDWGAWAGAGMAGRQRDARGSGLRGRGLGELPVADGLAALEHALVAGRAHVLAVSADWPGLAADRSATGAVPPLLRLLATAAAPADDEPHPASIRDELAARPEATVEILERHVAEQVRRVLGMAPGAPLDARRGFFELGLDSILSVQLRAGLAGQLGAPLSSTAVFDHPNVLALAAYVRELLAPTPPAAPDPGPELSLDQLTASLEALVGMETR